MNKEIKFTQRNTTKIIDALMYSALYNTRFYSIAIHNVDDILYKITVYNDDIVYMYIEITVYSDNINSIVVSYKETNKCITHTYIDVFTCNNSQIESTITGEVIYVI